MTGQHTSGGTRAARASDYRPTDPIRWDSWGDFVRAAEARIGNPGWKPYVNEAAFCNGLNLRDAVDLAKRGWTTDLPRIDRIVGQVRAKVRARTEPDWEYDVEGGEVDVARFVTGEPECMIESAPHRETRFGRAVRLIVPVSSCYFQDVDRLRVRGIAIMALVDCLQQARMTLEIWAVDARHKVRGGPRAAESRRCQVIPVKAANQPLDMGQLMFALANPAMGRRLALATMEPQLTCSGGFCPGPYDARVTDLPDTRGRGQTIVLPADAAYAAGAGNWDTDDGAAEWVEHQLGVITGDK